MTKILIAGCGDIGTRLADILSQKGHRVVGLRRNPPGSGNAAMVYCKADMTQAQDLARLDFDFDQVFFMPAPDCRDTQAYEAVYQTGLNNLLNRFAAQARRPHWFLISSTSVYGQSKGEWVDEQSPAEPKTDTGKIIRQAELKLLTANPNHVVVRCSGIYGAGRERLLKMASQTPAVQFQPPYFTNRLHQDDCAAILAFLLERRLTGQPLDNYYLASDDDPAPLWEVMTWLAGQLKHPPPTPQQAAKTLDPDQNKRCCNLRLKTLGYRFVYPTYKNGYLPLVKG